MITETIERIKIFHARQMYGDQEYYLHCVEVMNTLDQIVLSKLSVTDQLATKLMALLHDTLEDTIITEKNLLDMGYSEDVINGVIQLTRYPSEKLTYQEKILKIANCSDIRVILVKYADNTVNLNNCHNNIKANVNVEKHTGMAKRYTRSMSVLEKKIDEWKQNTLAHSTYI